MNKPPAKTIFIEKDISWVPQPNEAHMILDETPPPVELCTATFGWGFYQGRLLMIWDANRLWWLPGGHIEPGETPPQALAREFYEEAQARIGDCGQIGYQKITLQGEKPENYAYPYPVSYQLAFWVRVESLDPFTRTDKYYERRLRTPYEVRAMPDYQHYLPMLEAALVKVI